jgi:prepilin-type N-terminal cleavage/methylation domain-containing protein
MLENRSNTRRSQSGFTLLEVMVAALVMGIAIAGVLNGLAGSSRNASRLTDYDRVTLLAKQRMDELLIDLNFPRNQFVEARYAPSVVGRLTAGWRARVMPFEAPPGAGPFNSGVDRIELEVWWMTGETRHSFNVEAFRRNTFRVGDPRFPQ